MLYKAMKALNHVFKEQIYLTIRLKSMFSEMDQEHSPIMSIFMEEKAIVWQHVQLTVQLLYLQHMYNKTLSDTFISQKAVLMFSVCILFPYPVCSLQSTFCAGTYSLSQHIFTQAAVCIFFWQILMSDSFHSAPKGEGNDFSFP